MRILAFLLLIILSFPIILVYGNPQLYYRPLQDGTQIYNADRPGYCSIGFASYYTEKIGNIILVYYGVVTASHCGGLGDHFYQPDNSESSYYLGTVQIDYPQPGSSPDPNRQSDSMWIYVETKQSGEYPSIVSTRVYWDGSKYAIADKYAREGDISYGQHIEKVGRTTGLTTGIICSTNEYWRRGAGWVWNTTLEAYYGDSGGIVYLVYEIVGPPDHPTAKYVKIYGIIQGGIPENVTWFCPVYYITDDLDVTPYIGGAP